MSAPRIPRTVAAVFVLLGAWQALFIVRNLFFAHTEIGPLFVRGSADVVGWTCVALCVWRVLARREDRAVWLFIALSLAAWFTGDVLYAALYWTADVVPFPNISDAFYLAFAPLFAVALLRLWKVHAANAPRVLWLDGLTAALTVSALSATFAFEPVLANVEGAPLAVATNLAYPLADVLLLGVIAGVLAARGWTVDRSIAWLAVGAACFWLADSFYLRATAAGTYEIGSWYDPYWYAAAIAFAWAAWRPPSTEAVRLDRARVLVMPIVFAATALVILGVGQFAGTNPVTAGLALAALAAVLVRLGISFARNVSDLRHSREEALTDALTGLGNRRALLRSLESELGRPRDEQPLVLGLYDLDGFKLYNDTFGHPAGDALLQRLGGHLAAHVAGRGLAFRLGGDEFCVLTRGPEQVAEAVAASAAAALSERGEGFAVSCSYGAVVLPREAADASEALRIADHRLYAAKHTRRGSAGRQSKDVLLRVLEERSPELAHHMTGVAALAVETARELGLDDDQVELVAHAAELHDVGKLAVPDAILLKNGPLDPGEWEFIRRHTLVGERIVAAAPALKQVGALVRSSHERWDGGGYPDGLEGGQIPLGARVVAVCDAYDAITAGRPYSAPRNHEEALAEIERCAASQFDPAVVRAFTAVARRRTATVLGQGRSAS